MNANQSTESASIHWPQPLATHQSLVSQRLGLPTSTPLAGLSRELGKQSVHAPQHAILDEVRKYYVLPSDSSVISFLSEHRGIAPILLEAAPRLKEHFGATTIFRLKAPVDESGARTLYAVVIWPGDVRDVRNSLKNFDNNWWLDHLQLASGHLNFTYELV